MNAIEHLADRVWERPSDYGGFSPDGDYVILTQHRDSEALDRSNYECALRELEEVAAKFPPPDDESAEEGRNGWVYDFRAGHWAVGWVETILVRADAPEEVLQAAGEIVCSLEDYPVLDEDHFSQIEFDEVLETWKWMSVRERVRLIVETKCGASIFAARSDELPHHDDGRLYDYLRTP